MSPVANPSAKFSNIIRERDLEPYVLELEVDGLTVVPPEVHGFPMDRIDQMVDLLLAKSQEMVGCAFSLDRGAHEELELPEVRDRTLSDGKGKPSQFLIQQLSRHHRLFRDLAVNPVAVVLIRHMIGLRATRFSSHNSFIKWQGDFGYGPHLGLHADQTTIPLPWGRTALTANTNWCLTDYTKEGGSLAYVPGSHRSGSRPNHPEATSKAVPVEAPKGSVILFHGATWHGAYPRLIPGMRISVANYYRHVTIAPQDDIRGTFPRELADDCDDPGLFGELSGFGDPFPYADQTELVPRVARG